jgi:hypothetical protein
MEKPLLAHPTKFVLSLLLAAAVVALAVYKGPELLQAFARVRPEWALAGVVFFAANYTLRAVRLTMLSPVPLRIWPEAVRVACLHGMASFLFPFRAGDLTLPVLLKAANATPLALGTRMLIKARLLDVAAMGVWMTAAALVLPAAIPFYFRCGWLALALPMAGAPWILKGMGRLGSRFTTGWLGRMAGAAARMNFSRLEILQSLAIWLTIGGFLFCATRAVGLELKIGEAWFLVSIQLPLQILPVQGIAQAGNHEGGWVAGLALLGIPPAEGLNFALTSHALILVNILALGPVALLARKKTAPPG